MSEPVTVEKSASRRYRVQIGLTTWRVDVDAQEVRVSAEGNQRTRQFTIPTRVFRGVISEMLADNPNLGTPP